MKNPFTGKEMPKKTFAEIFKLDFTPQEKKDKQSAPKEIELLQAEVKSLRAENTALKSTMAEIAQPQTNSIAKIRAAAQGFINEVSE